MTKEEVMKLKIGDTVEVIQKHHKMVHDIGDLVTVTGFKPNNPSHPSHKFIKIEGTGNFGWQPKRFNVDNPIAYISNKFDV